MYIQWSGAYPCGPMASLKSSRYCSFTSAPPRRSSSAYTPPSHDTRDQNKRNEWSCGVQLPHVFLTNAHDPPPLPGRPQLHSMSTFTPQSIHNQMIGTYQCCGGVVAKRALPDSQRVEELVRAPYHAGTHTQDGRRQRTRIARWQRAQVVVDNNLQSVG